MAGTGPAAKSAGPADAKGEYGQTPGKAQQKMTEIKEVCGTEKFTARENSQVTAWGNSQVTARGNSQVTAWGNSFIRVYHGKIIIVSPSAVVMVMPGFDGKIINKVGAAVLYAPIIDTAEKWVAHYGVTVKRGIATLYKAVDADFSTSNARAKGIFYRPGDTPAAPDWNPEPECGGGLHFSPHPALALAFNSSAVHFVACPVRVSDIVVHYPATYPDKVKAPRVCKPCYEVDRNGNKIEAE